MGRHSDPNSKGARLIDMMRAGTSLTDAAAAVQMTIGAARTALARRGLSCKRGKLVEQTVEVEISIDSVHVKIAGEVSPCS